MKTAEPIVRRALQKTTQTVACFLTRWIRSHALMIALPIVVWAVVAADACGCPNCKDAMVNGDVEGANLARGYFYSILIMLAMPFALVSSFGAYVWREMRRQKRAEASATNPPNS